MIFDVCINEREATAYKHDLEGNLIIGPMWAGAGSGAGSGAGADRCFDPGHPGGEVNFTVFRFPI
jgi:hypothetical protein